MFDNDNCYIIAELSCNHNGSLEEAYKVLHASKEAGADAIKLQTFTADTITRNFKHRPVGTMWEKLDLYALYQKAHTPIEWQIELKKEADKIGIDFLSSPFDETAVDFLVDQLNVSVLKVASFEAIDNMLLKKMAKTGLPIIMSNGMMDYMELYEAFYTLKDAGAKDITLLQCNSGYPALFSDANLKTMKVMKDIFNCQVGLSDHTLFYDTKNFKLPLPHVTPLEAVKLGAKVVEVHIQMDRAKSKELMDQGKAGFDWAFSRNPEEFRLMVQAIREYEKTGVYNYQSENEKLAAKQVLGDVIFSPTTNELSSRQLRPSLWAVRSIQKGSPFIFAAEKDFKSTGNFDSIRPGGGLHIRYAAYIEGKRAACDIPEGTPIDWSMISV